MIDGYWGNFCWHPCESTKSENQKNGSFILPNVELHWNANSQHVHIEHRQDWVIFKWGSIRHQNKNISQHQYIAEMMESLLGGVFAKSFLENVEGEFVILIWNTSDHRLYLATDPFGITKLYFARHKEGVFISSHPKDVAKYCGRLDLSPEGLTMLFSMKGIIAPYSILKGVSVLKPAELLEMWETGERSEEYWQILDQVDTPFKRNYEQAQTDILDILANTIRSFANQDTKPLGICLSGGIDSALLLGLLKASGISTYAYTMGYNPTTRNDESHYAFQNAESIGIPVKVLLPTDTELASLLEKTIRAMPEPIADATVLPQLYLANEAKNSSTSLLDGTGADNIFGGLTKFGAENMVKKYHRVPPFFRRRIISPVLQLLPSSRYSKFTDWVRKAQKFTYGAELPPDVRNIYWSRFLSEMMVKRIIDPDWYASSDFINEIIFHLLQRASVLKSDFLASSYASIRGTLPIHAMQKLTTIKYATGLNIYMPYVTPHMIEFSLSLPDNYKLQGEKTKLVLRDAAAKILPIVCLSRRKANFSPPIGRWMEGVFYEELLAVLKDQRLFNKSQIESMLKQQFSNYRDWQWELWAIFVVLKWWNEVNC